MSDSKTYIVTPASKQDFAGIKALYQNVARQGGGIARTEEEITDDYIHHNLENALARGISYLAKSGEQIVGEIHAYRPVPALFAHVLSDLTIAVHPDFQGCGVGRAIFSALLDEVKTKHSHILRVELFVRESNLKAQEFYQSLGFHIEGHFQQRVRRLDGELEADIPMAWVRQN
ncbi:GNAT family N-acetyltransferase [Undibacterium baiyunense]|uniref:GNAT family N-acetyltransferase n=1 Tax=Undibacterium baiyunense TaxID=2828731 RepID=A0A941DET0_9BURK|nr:GNAT family N-acetyltransferase [Undibacterium baiyunense]MBR7746328.1 GNAT family N-acetyltransferase [Undibacterium baiyunense]